MQHFSPVSKLLATTKKNPERQKEARWSLFHIKELNPEFSQILTHTPDS